MIQGRVLRSQSGFYWVETSDGVVECRLRGRLKKIEQKSDIAVIGDMVMIEVVSPGYGAVESVLPRTTRLSRVAAFSGGSKEDVIVANVDVAIIVVALAQPEFHPRMLDRYLVICENNDIEARIVASKADLVTPEQAEAALAPYRAVGYTTCVASVHSGQGLAEVQSWLPGKVSVVNPKLALAVGDVSSAVNKGRHTTTVAQLIPLGNGGYVADTPGIREIALWKIDHAALAYGFREFHDYLDECHFGNCTHAHEPDCAVRAALEQGEINPARYGFSRHPVKNPASSHQRDFFI